jgi:hypothetical protein
MLWRRYGPPFPAGIPDTYEGLLRPALTPFLWLFGVNDPYKNDFPELQGPGGQMSERWQSRCRKGDAWCGEGFGSSPLDLGQKILAAACQPLPVPPCEHQKYHEGKEADSSNSPYHPVTRLTMNGGKFLALKTFPELFTTDEPRIVHIETFVEGVHVYFRLYYTDPHHEVTGFSFSWNGGQREFFSFSDPPYWARVHIDELTSTGRVDYPFNHLCDESGAYVSEVEAWVDASTRSSDGIKIHMACDAPKEVITPFFDH